MADLLLTASTAMADERIDHVMCEKESCRLWFPEWVMEDNLWCTFHRRAQDVVGIVCAYYKSTPYGVPDEDKKYRYPGKLKLE